MKKYLEEVAKYIWVPFILGLLSYIFFQLHDVPLGLITLLVFSAGYTLLRLYFHNKRWLFLVILGVIVLGSAAFLFTRNQGTILTINGQAVTTASVNLPGGSVSVSPALKSNGKYAKNAVVTLSASPTSGYDWLKWSGTDSNNVNPTTVTMSADKQVTVVFETRVSLIINNALVIGSTVTFSEGAIAVYPAPGIDGKYTENTVVTLTAIPAAGYDWRSWTGTDNDTANPATVTMDSNKQISVTLDPRFSLFINSQLVIGSVISFGEGSVTLNPAPGADDKYTRNTVVTLTATPAAGYGWKNWLGTANDTTSPTTVTISSDKHIVVSFEQRFQLTVNSQLATSSTITVPEGTISINPAPGTDTRYAKDTTLTLTATPASGYRFDHWSGDVTGKTNPVTITMNYNRSVTAVFMRSFNLAITVSPSAGGSVSPTAGAFDEGSVVALTATPAAGYRFDHWSGDATGTAAATNVTISTNRSVTAVFVKVYNLTISVSPAGGGTVAPASGTYDETSVVNLTATPAAGYRFDHWEGDATGNASSTSVTMNANKNVVAVFVSNP
jgi:hypothetical protein